MKQGVSEEEFRYFRQVNHRIQEAFESLDDEELFLANVFQEMCGREVDLSCDKFVSRVVEECLKKSLALNIFDHHLMFMEAMTTNLRLVCKNQFASHVVETLIHGVPNIFSHSFDQSEDDGNAEKDIPEKTEQWVIKLSKFVANNTEEFMTDRYASHIIRTLLELLGGRNVQKDLLKRKTSNKFQPAEIVIQNPESLPAVFTDLLKEFHDRLMDLSPSLQLWCCDELVSPVIQTLLCVMSHSQYKEAKRLMRLIMKITSIKTENGKTTLLLTDDKGSHMLELMLKICNHKLRKHWFHKYFKDRLHDLSVHPISNFIVQRLLQSIEDKELFIDIFNELAPSFRGIIEEKKTGVIVSISEACVRLSTCQGTFVNEMMKALNCLDEAKNKQNAFILCLCELSIYHDAARLPNRITLHGSLVLQNLLKFNKPIKIIQSILEIDENQLCKIACDNCGSHIIDSFMKSSTVGEKSRNKFVDRLKGQFTKLACDKHGSRSLDNIWESSSLAIKSAIAGELLAQQPVLQSNMFGKLIFKNFALFHFGKHRDQWKEIQTTNQNRKRLMSSLLQDKQSQLRRKRCCNGTMQHRSSAICGQPCPVWFIRIRPAGNPKPFWKPAQCYLQGSGCPLDQAEKFKYLEVEFTNDGKLEVELNTRTAKAGAVMCQLQQSVVLKRELGHEQKTSPTKKQKR